MSSEFEEAFKLLCGEKLGSGMSRDVYVCTLLPDCVVKVETLRDHFQNIVEWELWKDVQGTPAAEWFAECKWISPNGQLMIQERTRPAAPIEFPERIPIWFTDTKRTNWGVSLNRKGKIICHDYGISLIFRYGTDTKKMQKAKWWDV